MKFTRQYNTTEAKQFTKSKLKPLKNPKRNVYEVTVVHMHGDADHYTT